MRWQTSMPAGRPRYGKKALVAPPFQGGLADAKSLGRLSRCYRSFIHERFARLYDLFQGLSTRIAAPCLAETIIRKLDYYR